MRSVKIHLTAVDVRICSKSPSKHAVVRKGPRLLALTLLVARSTLAVERFAIGRLREIQTSREERRTAATGYSMPSKICWTADDCILPAVHLYDRRSMWGDRFGAHEALRTDRSGTSRDHNGRTSATCGSTITSVAS